MDGRATPPSCLACGLRLSTTRPGAQALALSRPMLCTEEPVEPQALV